MLQGKFSQEVPIEQRQMIGAELDASDQPALNQPVQYHSSVTGEQQVIITQPLGTTVEDVQPTLTWDATIDGWSYQVHVDDQNSRARPLRQAGPR